MSSDPGIKTVPTVSPTGVGTLLECPLHFSFQRSGGGEGLASPAAMIGIVCHSVLERQVKEQPQSADLEAFVATAWAESAAAVERGEGVPPGTLSSSPLPRSRLQKTARHLAAILSDAGQAQYICEQEMTARGGVLLGRPDLVIRGEQAHWIVDYKSGSAFEPDGTPNEHYTTQIQLYAVLEHEASGSWPSRAIILPLRGPRVELEIDPTTCEALASRAVKALETYNSSLRMREDARASPNHCRWCEWACNCDSFWEAAKPEWAAGGLIAVSGEVSERVDTKGAGSTVKLLGSRGTVELEEAIWVRGISRKAHPEIFKVSSGDAVAFARLRADRQDGVFVLPDSGLMARV